MNRNKPIYICSPLFAPSKEGMLCNMLVARYYARVVSFELHNRALASHAWLPELLDDTIPKERTLALDFGKQLLEMCGALVICHPTITKGMAGEIEAASRLGLAILIRPSPGNYYPVNSFPEVGVSTGWRDWIF